MYGESDASPAPFPGAEPDRLESRINEDARRYWTSLPLRGAMAIEIDGHRLAEGSGRSRLNRN